MPLYPTLLGAGMGPQCPEFPGPMEDPALKPDFLNKIKIKVHTHHTHTHTTRHINLEIYFWSAHIAHAKIIFFEFRIFLGI